MEVVQSRESKKDVNLHTAQLVQLLTQIGPDIPEIARKLGQFKESVRYRYKQKILSRGFAVQALPSYEKLGLTRVIMIVDFGREYQQYASPILTAMNELCYVVGFYRTIPEGEFVIHASVPNEYASTFVDFMRELESWGMFAIRDEFEFERFRNPPMRVEHYDFNTGRWDFDWSSPPFPGHSQTLGERPPREEFDKTDLLVIKELQIDANKPLIEIADKLGVNYKKLTWHHARHVVERGLIEGFRVNWLGTRYDYRLDRALHRKHRYVIVDLFAKNLEKNEIIKLASQTNRLPFVFAEAMGMNYYANLGIPVDFINEALNYLGTVMEPVRDRAYYRIGDQNNALAFNLSYNLFDESRDAWVFDRVELKQKFEGLMMTIKKVG